MLTLDITLYQTFNGLIISRATPSCLSISHISEQLHEVSYIWTFLSLLSGQEIGIPRIRQQIDSTGI